MKLKPYVRLAFLLLAACGALLFPKEAAAQNDDTLRVMVYNILRYANETIAGCDVDCKTEAIETVVKHVRPDVLGVNELFNEERYADSLLKRVMNKDTTPIYARAAMNANWGGDIRNMLFYNQEKLALQAQYRMATETRLDIYKMYYKSADLALGDTVFIHFVLLHLKAGSQPQNEAERLFETNLVLDTLQSIGLVENIILMGDLNVQRHTDASFQNLLNASGLFAMKDPINRLGEWNENAGYVDVHTQSTRTTSESDGGVFGGSDDRLDFILCNQPALDGLLQVEYLNGSYRAVGQDGSFFNQSVLDAVAPPQYLKDALWAVSDHLPVQADFKVDAKPETPLSLRFFRLEAKAEQGGVRLRWAAPGGPNALTYAVERSTDGARFRKISGEIPAKPSEEMPTKYEYFDAAVRSGVTYYYRIIERRIGGGAELSPLAAAVAPGAHAHAFSVALFPNPFEDALYLQVSPPDPAPINLRVVALDGRTVWRGEAAPGPGGLRELGPQLSDLPPGVYHLEARNGSRRAWSRLIRR